MLQAQEPHQAKSRSRTNNHYHTRIPNPNTSRLHPGDQLTYKELISILDEDFIPPTNSSRKKQLRDFQSLFSYTQGPGRKLTIKEIYPSEEIKAKQEAEQAAKQKTKAKAKSKTARAAQSDERNKAQPTALSLLSASPDLATTSSDTTSTPSTPLTLPEKILYPYRFIHTKRSKYYLPLANIVLRYLPQKYGASMYFSPTQLYECCGMTNIEYSMTNHSQKYSASTGEWQATANEVHWFYDKTPAIFRQTVRHQLNILAELGALSFGDSFLLFTTDQGFFPATAKEVMQIREAENYVLDDFQMASTCDVMLRRKTKEFYQKVLEALPKEFRGERYYNCYHIRVNDWVLEEVSPMEDAEYCQWKKKMNDLVIEAFDKSVDKHWQKYCEKITAEAEAGKDIHYYSQRFVDHEKHLAEELLRIKDRDDEE